MHWWYERDGQSIGPISEQVLVSLISQGELTSTTLVWQQDLASWTLVQDLQTLASHLPPKPPPLPPPLPKPTLLEPSPSPAYIKQSTTTNVHPADSAIQEKSEPHIVPSTEAAAAPATWYRFFARQIDLLLIGFPAVFLGFIAVGAVATPAFVLQLQDPGMATASAVVMLCLLAPLVEASVLRIFGNTPGKALFGLRVVSISGEPLNFVDQVKRAYRVMVYGLGLYLPIASLFTGLFQLNRIRKSGSTGYDSGLFRVSERALSGMRKFVAVSIWVLSFMGLFALNVWDRHETTRIAAPKAWTNPATLLSTTIPGGWDVTSQLNEDGQTVHMFTNASKAVQVVFAAEDLPSTQSLDGYVAAFVNGVSSTMRVSQSGGGAMIAGHSVRVHPGELLSPKVPIEVTFAWRGNTVWRTVAIRLGDTSSGDAAVEELRAAVFRTVPTQ